LLLVLVSTVTLDSEFHRTHDHILLSDGSGDFSLIERERERSAKVVGE
jgi:hypothetical protein